MLDKDVSRHGGGDGRMRGRYSGTMLSLSVMKLDAGLVSNMRVGCRKPTGRWPNDSLRTHDSTKIMESRPSSLQTTPGCNAIDEERKIAAFNQNILAHDQTRATVAVGQRLAMRERISKL